MEETPSLHLQLSVLLIHLPGYTLSLPLWQRRKVPAAKINHTHSIYLPFHRQFSSWPLSPILFSVLANSPGNSNHLRPAHPPACFHPKLLPCPFAGSLSPNPYCLQATQPGVFHLCCMDATLEGLSKLQLSKVSPGLSAYDHWAPHHQAAFPSIKYKLLWALVVIFLFAPSASVAPPGGWSPFQSPLVPTAQSFCLRLPPPSHLFPNYANKTGP